MDTGEAFEVAWSAIAQRQLQKISDYIDLYSTQYSIAVILAVRKAVYKMARHPYAYPVDGRKRNNNGTYRFLVVYSYRVSFRIVGNTCRIVGIRHVKQEAKMY